MSEKQLAMRFYSPRYDRLVDHVAELTELQSAPKSTFFTSRGNSAALTFIHAVNRCLLLLYPFADTHAINKASEKIGRRFMITGKVFPHPQALTLALKDIVTPDDYMHISAVLYMVLHKVLERMN